MKKNDNSKLSGNSNVDVKMDDTAEIEVTTSNCNEYSEVLVEDTKDLKRHPLDYVDEITALLKTAFPLLTLSMETMVDQILYKLKPSMDEDIYRLIVALMTDGVQVFL
jgi:transformation/transcription domain-associated protein